MLEHAWRRRAGIQFNTDDDLFYEAIGNTPRRLGRSRKRGRQSEVSLDETVIGARLKRPSKHMAPVDFLLHKLLLQV